MLKLTSLTLKHHGARTENNEGVVLREYYSTSCSTQETSLSRWRYSQDRDDLIQPDSKKIKETEVRSKKAGLQIVDISSIRDRRLTLRLRDLLRDTIKESCFVIQLRILHP
jgi:hypothetical protein